MIKQIETPDISSVSTARLGELLRNGGVRKLVQKADAPVYYHWEKIKHWPMPEGVTAVEVWAFIKFVRKEVVDRKRSVVVGEKGQAFTWTPWLPGLEEFLHQIDMKLGGDLFISEGQLGSEAQQHRLLSRGIIEEAIASSQLEGAHTSRKAAKQMILERRKPRNNDEQMIANNYQAMRLIEDELKDKKLDEDTLLTLHKILTANTSEDKGESGRYRRDEDDIVVGDNMFKDEIYHIPPKEDFVRNEIQRFIAYANNDLKDNSFVHPVIKAIILHFWIGYLHPFTDGNGRMARALFYWYLLREKYWAFGYLPLSKVIKNSPIQYRDAYMYTEQDDNDLTYFIDYNIKKITQAKKEFELYAEGKRKENKHMARLARGTYQLNERQIQLLRYFYKNKDATTSVTTHAKVYEISRLTAMKDLKQLEQKGFVVHRKIARTIYYSATDNVIKLFG